MTSSSLWRSLPSGLAEALEPELARVADEIALAIGHEVPEYARPLEGAFGRGVRTGVAEALHRFVSQIRQPGAADEAGRRVYVTLGRQEYGVGRTLDALQAAYRVGARVAWRRFAQAGYGAGFSQETMAELAESIFAYIDELSSESVEGYAQAQAEHAGERQRAVAELIGALLAEPPIEVDLRALAAAAGWRLPKRAAVLVCSTEALPGIARRLGPEVLHAQHRGVGCIVIPDAEGPGRRTALWPAVRDAHAVIGPEQELRQLPRSWHIAVGALSAVDSRTLVIADEHLAELMLADSASVIERIVERRLPGLADLTPMARERMLRTALAFVQHQGNAAAMARDLEVHPQTARYRIARLRELLGSQLDDPAARFELEAGLRHCLARPPA